MNLLQYLMPRVRDDIKYYGRLNFHLFQARLLKMVVGWVKVGLLLLFAFNPILFSSENKPNPHLLES